MANAGLVEKRNQPIVQMIKTHLQTRGSPNHYTHRVLLTTCLIAAVGIVSRTIHVGSLLWDKYLGDVVYAAFFYLLLSLAWREGTITMKALLTAAYVVAIEVFQLTQIPAHLSHSANLFIRLFAYIVLGSAFSWWDMLAYGIGIVGISLADRLYLREKANGKERHAQTIA